MRPCIVIFAILIAFAWLDGYAQTKNPMDSEVALILGSFYPDKYQGVLVAGGKSPAIDELLVLAKGGDKKAQHVMGMVYTLIAFRCCEKSEKDRNKFEAAAAALFQASANQGLLDSMRMLAHAYQSGKGVERDEKKAIDWFERAAASDDWLSLESLGDMAYEGKNGFSKDKEHSARYYEKAAELGGWTAQLKIGRMYEDGDGVPQDYQRAMRWYVKCYEEYRVGLEARTRIGNLYLKGLGVPVDPVSAYAWYLSALKMKLSVDSRNRKEANKALKQLQRSLTREQIAEARAYKFPNGEQYVGEWKGDKYHGQGTYLWPDGRNYVGEWKNDEPDGRGMMTFADGRVKSGQWQSGKFVGP